MRNGNWCVYSEAAYADHRCRHRLSQARRQHRLTDHLELVRCFYNFIRPHGALKFGKLIRTPAMQAGLVSRRLRFCDILRAVSGSGASQV